MNTLKDFTGKYLSWSPFSSKVRASLAICIEYVKPLNFFFIKRLAFYSIIHDVRSINELFMNFNKAQKRCEKISMREKVYTKS